MLYGVQFGDYHTLSDWGLKMTGAPTISPPEPVTYEVSIPGADGTLDLTEAVTGHVFFRRRTITFELISTVPVTDWTGLQSEIVNAIHGKTMKIICDDDPLYYWEGRVSVDKWVLTKKVSKVTISASVNPLKWERELAQYVGSYPNTYTERVELGGINPDPSDSWGSSLLYGSEDEPELDLSGYSSITINCNGTWSYSEISIYDADGNHWTEKITTSAKARSVTWRVESLTNRGLDVTRIYKIVTFYGKDPLVTAVTLPSAPQAVIAVDGATRTTIPEIVIPDGVRTLVFDGKTYTIGRLMDSSGNVVGVAKKLAIRLNPGINKLLFRGNDSAPGNIYVTFRRGWL